MCAFMARTGDRRSTAALEDLAQTPQPPETILAALERHANECDEISISTVQRLLEGSGMAIDALDLAYMHAETGLFRQIRVKNPYGTVTYFNVMVEIALRIGQKTMFSGSPPERPREPLARIRSYLTDVHHLPSGNALELAMRTMVQYAVDEGCRAMIHHGKPHEKLLIKIENAVRSYHTAHGHVTQPQGPEKDKYTAFP